MKRGMLFAVLCFASTGVSAQESLAILEEQAFKDATARVSEMVVQIQTFGGLDRVGETLTGIGPTTGVIVSEDGYVVSSAFNFVSKPAAVVVKLSDDQQRDATIIATDHSRMLTLLKIDANGLAMPEPASIAEAKVGQWTLAVGKAFSPRTPNVSPGVLSAKNRIWGKALQTDAKTSPFNYGGPLINVHGRVLGIIVPLSMTSDEVIAGTEWYDSGIGFAVPMDQVMSSVERLKSGEDLHRGSLGITPQKPGQMFAEPIAGEIRDGSPAAVAGLKTGDLIVAIDGRPIDRQADAMQALGPKYAGDAVEVTVKRDGKEVTVTATLAKPAEPSIVPKQTPAQQPGDDEPGAPRSEGTED